MTTDHVAAQSRDRQTPAANPFSTSSSTPIQAAARFRAWGPVVALRSADSWAGVLRMTSGEWVSVWAGVAAVAAVAGNGIALWGWRRAARQAKRDARYALQLEVRQTAADGLAGRLALTARWVSAAHDIVRNLRGSLDALVRDDDYGANLRELFVHEIDRLREREADVGLAHVGAELESAAVLEPLSLALVRQASDWAGQADRAWLWVSAPLRQKLSSKPLDGSEARDLVETANDLYALLSLLLALESRVRSHMCEALGLARHRRDRGVIVTVDGEWVLCPRVRLPRWVFVDGEWKFERDGVDDVSDDSPAAGPAPR